MLGGGGFDHDDAGGIKADAGLSAVHKPRRSTSRAPFLETAGRGRLVLWRTRWSIGAVFHGEIEGVTAQGAGDAIDNEHKSERPQLAISQGRGRHAVLGDIVLSDPSETPRGGEEGTTGRSPEGGSAYLLPSIPSRRIQELMPRHLYVITSLDLARDHFHTHGPTQATQKKIRANELTTLEQRKKAAAAHSQMSQALKAIEGTACTLKLQLDASRTENRRLRDDADASNAKLLGVIEDLNGKISYYSETVHSHANKRAELENALLQRTKELRAAHTELCALRERLSRAEASAAHDVSQRAAAEKRALHASRGALELMKATSIRSRSERRRSSIAVPCASH